MNERIYVRLGDGPFERMVTITLEKAGFECVSDAKAPDITLAVADNVTVGEIKELKKRIPCLVLDYEAPKDGEEHLLRPFDTRALCQAVKRIAFPDTEGEREKPSLVLDETGRRAEYGKKSVSLTESEFRLLSLLHARRGSTVSDGEIACAVWGKVEGDGKNDSNITAVYVNYLRKKLSEICAYPLIKRVRGEGYRMTEEDRDDRSDKTPQSP